MVKRPLIQIAYSLGLSARFAPPSAIAPDPFRQLATTGRLGHSGAAPTTVLLSAEEAKARLREIVEGFFFRRLKGEDTVLRNLDTATEVQRKSGG
jgi:hypothetical protein